MTQKYLTPRQWLKWLPSVPLGLRFGSLKRWIYADLRTNSNYFLIQHYVIRFYNRDGVCLLRGTDSVFKHYSHSSSFQTCRATTQADSRRPLTADARVQSQVRSFEIYGGQSGTGTGLFFPPSISSFSLSVSFHKYSMLIFIYLYVPLTRSNGRSLGTFKRAISGSTEQRSFTFEYM